MLFPFLIASFSQEFISQFHQHEPVPLVRSTHKPSGVLPDSEDEKWIYPLPRPAIVTSGFSGSRYHPVLRRYRPHWGIDLALGYGTLILSAHSGKVILAGDAGDGYGYKVVIEQESGLIRTLYAHMQPKLFVRVGDSVRPGQPIGKIGMTGYTTGPHLHFEVHRYQTNVWVRVDPAPILNRTEAIATQDP